MDSETSNVVGESNGRISQGITYQCAHSNNQYKYPIMDWSPPEECTVQLQALLSKVTRLWTVRLSPTDNGTRTIITFGRPSGPGVYRVVENMIWRLFGNRMAKKFALNGCRRFEVALDQELA